MLVSLGTSAVSCDREVVVASRSKAVRTDGRAYLFMVRILSSFERGLSSSSTLRASAFISKTRADLICRKLPLDEGELNRTTATFWHDCSLVSTETPITNSNLLRPPGSILCSDVR